MRLEDLSNSVSWRIFVLPLCRTPSVSSCSMFKFSILRYFRPLLGKHRQCHRVSAETYTEHGLPFYKIYNEESSIKGGFQDIKSIGQMDKIKNISGTGKKAHKQDSEPTYNNPIIPSDSKGFPMKFRSVHDLEQNLARVKAFNL